MINKLSQVNNSVSFFGNYTEKPSAEKQKYKHKEFTDSFLRNAKEATPMLLGMTSVITVFDYGKNQVEIPKLLKKNMLRYFAPVLIGTSVLSAFIETKKTKKSLN